MIWWKISNCPLFFVRNALFSNLVLIRSSWKLLWKQFLWVFKLIYQLLLRLNNHIHYPGVKRSQSHSTVVICHKTWWNIGNLWNEKNGVSIRQNAQRRSIDKGNTSFFNLEAIAFLPPFLNNSLLKRVRLYWINNDEMYTNAKKRYKWEIPSLKTIASVVDILCGDKGIEMRGIDPMMEFNEQTWANYE